MEPFSNRPISLVLGFAARRGTSFARRNSIEEALDMEHELMELSQLQLTSAAWTDEETVLAGCVSGEVRLEVLRGGTFEPPHLYPGLAD